MPYPVIIPLISKNIIKSIIKSMYKSFGGNFYSSLRLNLWSTLNIKQLLILGINLFGYWPASDNDSAFVRIESIRNYRKVFLRV